MKNLNGLFKYITGWILVFLIRLIPFRAPNIEPVMATIMPFSKRYGAIGAFLFGALSIGIFDLATGKVGQWTLITAAAYGIVGVGSALYFRSRVSSRKNYVIYAIVGTIFYDATTGLSIGPLFFDLKPSRSEDYGYFRVIVRKIQFFQLLYLFRRPEVLFLFILPCEPLLEHFFQNNFYWHVFARSDSCQA